VSGFLQEKNGDRSSRRLYAAAYVLASLVLFGTAAAKNSQWAFWAGVATTVASIVYPILTTTQEIKEVVQAAKSLKEGE
jgi:hypothetical protein